MTAAVFLGYIRVEPKTIRQGPESRKVFSKGATQVFSALRPSSSRCGLRLDVTGKQPENVRKPIQESFARGIYIIRAVAEFHDPSFRPSAGGSGQI